MESTACSRELDDTVASEEPIEPIPSTGFFEMFVGIMKEEVQDGRTIAEGLRSFSNNYSATGLKQPDSVNFDVAVERARYLYMYAACHVHGATLSLEKFREGCRAKFDDWIKCLTAIKICSIGGGPGCDVIGILHFLNRDGLLDGRIVECTVVDKYERWESTFRRSLKKFCELFSVSVVYPHFIPNDLFGTFSEKLKETIKQSDLIVMNKFISSIVADKRCYKVIKEILTFMKLGALLVFIDNSGSGHAIGLTRKVARECNMQNLHYGYYRVSFEKEQQHNEYSEAFEFNSKRNIDIITIIWQKSTASYSDDCDSSHKK